MAINLNANLGALAAGGRLNLGGAANGTPAPAGPAAATAAAAPPRTISQVATALGPAAVAVNPAAFQIPSTVFQPPVFTPPIFTPPIFVPPAAPPVNKTATQLANSAIAQLSAAATGNVTTALNAVKSKSLDGPGLIPYLERKVRIGEVLNEMAKDWSAPTRSDFAAAFNMDAANLNDEVLDSIVSIAILNDTEITAEILGENMPQTTPTDLTDNRRIVWQSVPPGTPLNPPYVVLVAVEYQDVAKAEDVLNAILNQLGTTGSGFRLPKTVIQKGIN
jgi:hypothetical protein